MSQIAVLSEPRIVADPVRASGSGLRRVVADRQVRAGLALSSLVVLIALLGPLLAPHDPEQAIGAAFAGPASGSPLGLDYLGADVLSRVLAGGRALVWMTVTAAVAALVVGTAIGVLAAWRGGIADRIASWVADVLLAFPNTILVLLVVAMLGDSRPLMVATVAVAFLSGVIRLARAATQEVLTQEYVQATVLMGVPTRRILWREVVPNISTPLLVHLGTMLTWAVELLAGLSFLGYGVAAPAADWGLMINENRAGLRIEPWGVLAPVVLIALFAIGTNLIAEGAARATGTRAGAER